MKYVRHLYQIGLCLAFITLMGMTKGTRDAMQFHNARFIEVTDLDKSFWNNPGETSCNKYVSCEDKRERFFGSSTVFVSFTDGWHLLETLILFFTLLAVVVYRSGEAWYFVLIDIPVLWIIRQAGFYLTYNIIF